MKCKKCGNEFEGKFCSKCGAPAESSEQNPQYTSTSVKPKKSIYKRWWFWVIIAIIFIVIIANLGGNKGKTDDGSSAVPNTTASQTDKNTLQTESAKDDLSNVAKEYTLTAGYYTAGIDFPAGKCNVTAISGTGNLSSSNMYSGGINAMFGIDDGTGLYTGSFNGLQLPSKTTLSLNGVLKIKLEYTSVDSNFTGRIYDESAAITLKDGNYEADTDFTAGIYKISAVSGRGNLSSSNMYNGGMNEMFGVDDGTGMYNNQFLNANLEKGVTLSISGGLTIKLIPTK
jgi:hypothetical protein